MVLKNVVRPAYFIYTFVVALLAFQIVIAAGFIEKQKYDGIRIDMLGRQRMLTQKLSKEILLYSQNGVDAGEVLKTMRIFDTTMDGLINGGDVPVDLDMKVFRKIPPLNNDPVLDTLKRINSQWNEFSYNAAKFLDTKERKSFLYIVDENLDLLALVDDAVKMLSYSYEQRTFYLQADITAAVLTVVILLITLLVIRIRQIRKAREEILKLERILPICANCKRIRGEKMDPYKSSSWMNLEEYLKKENDINFSHGLCPDCAEKLYPGLLDKK